MILVSLPIGLIWTILSFLFFLVSRHFARPLTYIRRIEDIKKKNHLTIKSQHQPQLIRTWFTDPDEERWKRTNTLISWFHALITALLVIYSFWAYSPDIENDFVTHINWVTYFTCSFSFGYFFYDLLDVISNRQGSDLWEVTLHHIATLIFFGSNVYRLRNIGYQMFALIAEINSVFLHTRKLFHLYNIPRENFFVRLNMFLNILTFLFCRLVMLYFVSIFVYHDRYRVGNAYYMYVMYFLLPVMWTMNPILFYRILNTDFLKRIKSRKLMS